MSRKERPRSPRRKSAGGEPRSRTTASGDADAAAPAAADVVAAVAEQETVETASADEPVEAPVPAGAAPLLEAQPEPAVTAAPEPAAAEVPEPVVAAGPGLDAAPALAALSVSVALAAQAAATSLREVSMGPLTRDMTRLHDEIVSARRQRQDLMASVKRSSDERKEEVDRMTAGFAAARQEMAAQMAESHARFLGALRQHVGTLKSDVASDLAGARRAFLGGRG